MKKLLIMMLMSSIMFFVSCESDDSDDVAPAASALSYIKITMDGVEQTYTYGVTKDTTYTEANGEAAGFYGSETQQGKIASSASATRIIAAKSAKSYNEIFSTKIEEGIGLMIFDNPAASGTYTQPNAQIRFVKNGTIWQATSSNPVEIKVTTFDSVGGKIKGTFAGTISDGTDSKPVTGSFDVKRLKDFVLQQS